MITNINNNIRILRYAPSLSGDLHVGNVKIILLNYLIYKSNSNNKLILRYDDSDTKNILLSSLQNISLITHLLNINFTNIVFQSSHLSKVMYYVDFLKKQDLTYFCNCNNLSNCECYKKNNNSGVLMINVNKVLNNQDFIEINDLFYGKIRFKKSDMYNIAILRSDGSPLYNFVTVISDIIDNINLIIRGNDHIANTWKQIIIYMALGKEIPEFAHASLILDNKDKMSKSCNHSGKIIFLIKEGYTVEAIIKYLTTLIGLDENNNYIYTSEKDIIKCNNRNNQTFNLKKLENINYKVINSSRAFSMFLLFCTVNNFPVPNLNNLIQTIELIKYRHKTIKGLYDEIELFSTSYMPKYNLEENILTLEDFKFIKCLELYSNIYNLNDIKVRYILTGKKYGISIKEIKQIVSDELIKNRINYLLSFKIN